MNVCLQLLQPFLVLHTEVLLLVDDEEREVAEPDRLGEKCVGPDDDVDRAVGDPCLDRSELLGPHQTRGLADLHRQPGEARREGLVVLAGEQRRRHDDGHLFPGHGGDESGPECDFGLAESDVAAD